MPIGIFGYSPSREGDGTSDLVPSGDNRPGTAATGGLEPPARADTITARSAMSPGIETVRAGGRLRDLRQPSSA